MPLFLLKAVRGLHIWERLDRGTVKCRYFLIGAGLGTTFGGSFMGHKVGGDKAKERGFVMRANFHFYVSCFVSNKMVVPIDVATGPSKNYGAIVLDSFNI